VDGGDRWSMSVAGSAAAGKHGRARNGTRALRAPTSPRGTRVRVPPPVPV
jgi:hypothetical protein